MRLIGVCDVDQRDREIDDSIKGSGELAPALQVFGCCFCCCSTTPLLSVFHRPETLPPSRALALFVSLSSSLLLYTSSRVLALSRSRSLSPAPRLLIVWCAYVCTIGVCGGRFR